jgi:pimeloyl-ACP methyl ester carboxylesterase
MKNEMDDDGAEGVSRRIFMGLTVAASLSTLAGRAGAASGIAKNAPGGESPKTRNGALIPRCPKDHITRVKYKKVDVNGVSIFYREAGRSDAPAILLLHGWPSSSFEFRELLPLLAKNFRVVAPDYPGLGFSATPPPGQYDYGFDNIAKTLLGLADAIGLKRYALYITDFGACVGWIMARAAANRVTAVISQNGAAYDVGVIKADDAEWQKTVDLVKDPTPERRREMASALSYDYTKFTYVTGACDLSLVSPDTYTLDYALFQRPGQLEIQVELLISYAKFILGRFPEAQEYLRRHKPPVLAIWGANDPYYPKEGAEAFRADVPDVEVHFYDAGHFAIETHLYEIADHVTEFLKRRT